MARHTKEREREIRATLAELAKSGESVGKFARRHGMSTWTLYGWRKRFGSMSRGRSREAAATLIPVDVAQTSFAGVPFEVVVGDVSVRVAEGFDESELTRLIRALRSC